MQALEKLSSVAWMPALSSLIKVCALCNSSTLVEHGEEWYGVGDATEVALTVLAMKAKLVRPSSHPPTHPPTHLST